MKRLIALAIAALAFATASFSEIYQPCDWERQIVAACLILEASNQGEVGMQAVASVIGELEAGSLKDMGKVMAALRERYAGGMDFAKASAVAKQKLA